MEIKPQQLPPDYFEKQYDLLSVAVLAFERNNGVCPLDQALADAFEDDEQ